MCFLSLVLNDSDNFNIPDYLKGITYASMIAFLTLKVAVTILMLVFILARLKNADSPKPEDSSELKKSVSDHQTRQRTLVKLLIWLD